MNDITKKWIEASKILGKDKNAIIICPECNDGNLTIKDELIASRHDAVERYLICNACGKWNVITLNIINE